MSRSVDIDEEWFVLAVCAPLARRILDRIEISNGARMLNVACGIGIVARARGGGWLPVGAEYARW